jgi:hypothetical protein
VILRARYGRADDLRSEAPVLAGLFLRRTLPTLIGYYNLEFEENGLAHRNDLQQGGGIQVYVDI